MTGSDKVLWGWILTISGWVTCVLGVLLTVTLIGACIGLPMFLVGLVASVWGAIWLYSGYMDRQQEAISKGIRDGLASIGSITVNAPPLASVPTTARDLPELPRELPESRGVSDQPDVLQADPASSSLAPSETDLQEEQGSSEGAPDPGPEENSWNNDAVAPEEDQGSEQKP